MVAGVLWMNSDTGNVVRNYDFKLPHALKQGEFSFTEASGKVAIVNFWATWCAPCQRELPALLKLADHLGSSFVLVLISVDEDKQALTGFLKGFDLRLQNVEVLWDPASSVAGAFGTRQLPETYIFDRNRRFDRKVLGFIDWSNPEVGNYLLKLKDKSGT